MLSFGNADTSATGISNLETEYAGADDSVHKFFTNWESCECFVLFYTLEPKEK